MGGRDGLHDGQAQAAAARRAAVPGRPARSAPRWNRSKAWAASGSDMPGPASATSSTTPPRTGASRTATGVPGGVCSRTLPSRLASTCRIRASSTIAISRAGRLRLHRAVRLHRRRVGGRVPDQPGQVGLGQVQRGGAVQPGQFEQFGHQRAHPLRLLLDAAHRVRQLVRAERALPVQLGVAADGRQRGAQLVRGVRGELADLLLGPQPGAERLLDPVQHGVDRPAQPAHLGAVVGIRHPRGQVALGGDPLRGARHLAERGQAAADQPAPAHREQQDQRPAGDQLGDHDAPDLIGDGVDRAGDEHDRVRPAATAMQHHADGPQPRPAVHPRHGERVAAQEVPGVVGGDHAAYRGDQFLGGRAGAGQRLDRDRREGDLDSDVVAGVAGDLLRLVLRGGQQFGVELAASRLSSTNVLTAPMMSRNAAVTAMSRTSRRERSDSRPEPVIPLARRRWAAGCSRRRAGCGSAAARAGRACGAGS